MQINGLLSMLMNLPSANAGAGLLGGTDLLNNGQTTGNQVGFSGLLGADGKPTAKNPLLTDNTPPGDITPTPQVSDIAVPPIPMYIDQPIQQNGVQVADNTGLNIANDGSKGSDKSKAIFASLINNTKPLASELKNTQDFAAYGRLHGRSALTQLNTQANAQGVENVSGKPAAKTALDNNTASDGKLDLSSLNLKPEDTKTQVTPEEFQTALANLDKLAGKKNEGKPELYTNAKVTSAKEVKVSDRTSLNDKFAEATHIDNTADKVANKASDKAANNKTADINAADQNVADNNAFDASKKSASDILNKLHESKAAAKPVANALAKDEVATENKGNAKIEDNFAAKLQEINSQVKASHNTEAKISEISNKSATDQVQIKISQAAANGLDSIKIKLQPAELGAVDVEMKLDNSGNTQIRIVAERAETLDMLRKDSHALSQSLRDSGIKTDAGNLEFSLRGGNQNQQFAQNSSQFNQGHGNSNYYGRNDAYGFSNKANNLSEKDITINLSQNNKGLNIFA